MKWTKLLIFLCVISTTFCEAKQKHYRDGSNLPQKEREFAQLLSLRERRIFCGRFNHKQRMAAIKYASGRRKDSCLTPDEAVVRVMEDTGMSLAVKHRREINEGK